MQRVDKTLTVLVTGVGGPAGVNIVRLLKKRTDVVVIGCDVDELSAGRFFVDEFTIAPRVTDVDAYKQWTKEIVSSRQPDILIPTVDEELHILATFADQLNCFVPLSSVESLTIAADKLLSYDYIRAKLPLLVPAYTQLSKWTRAWRSDEEYFIKPRRGRGARGCRIVSAVELVMLAENMPSGDEYIVMELLPGMEWTVDAYVAADGTCSYLVPRERIGLSGGISMKGRTVNHQVVIDATKELLSVLPLRGPVCVQWKQDITGQPKFIEVNPRLSGGLMISVLAGVDPVAALMHDYRHDLTLPQEWSEVTAIGYFDYQKIE